MKRTTQTLTTKQEAPTNFQSVLTTTVKITKIEEFESNPNLMAALFSHVSAVPPFGPFAHLSAAEFCSKMQNVPQDEVVLVGGDHHQINNNNSSGAGNTITATVVYEIKPALVMALFMKLWEIDQWRHMGHLYVPMDLRVSDVDHL